MHDSAGKLLRFRAILYNASARNGVLCIIILSIDQRAIAQFNITI